MLQSMEGQEIDEDTLQVLMKAERLKPNHGIELTMQLIRGHADAQRPLD